MIDRYAIQKHGDAELKRATVVKTTKPGGVLKAHWRDALGRSGYAWFDNGRRFEQGGRGRNYINTETGEVYANLAAIVAEGEE